VVEVGDFNLTVKNKPYARGVISGVDSVLEVVSEILAEPAFRAQLEKETGLQTMEAIRRILEKTLEKVHAEVGDQLA
jgi:C4-type Zn-finger protein